MESNCSLDIERAAYDEFLTLWGRGEFEEQRLGQAFYNYFHLHKLTDQAVLHGLYEVDGKKAMALISRVVQLK